MWPGIEPQVSQTIGETLYAQDQFGMYNTPFCITQLAGAVEYTNCSSAEG